MFKKQLVAYLLPNIAQAVASFGTVAITTRMLSDAEYGRYSLIFTTMTLAQYVFTTWAEAAAARFYATAEAKDQVNNHFKTLLVSFSLNALLFAFAAALITIFYPGDKYVKIALAAAFGGAIVRSLLKIALETRRMNLQSFRYSAVESFHTFTGFILTIVFVAWLNFKEDGPFIATMIAALLSVLIEAPFLIKLSKGGKFELPRAKEYYRFGIGIAGGLLLMQALATGDRYFIAYFIDDAAVGAYSAGYQVAARILDIIFVYITGVTFPILVNAYEKGSKEEFRQAAFKSCNLRFAIGMPAAVGISLVAKPLTDVLIGTELRDTAAHITPYITAGALFLGLSDYFSDAFLITKRVFERALLMLIPAIINIVLNIIMIPAMGIEGAAWATIISYFVGLLLLAIRSRKYIKLPFPGKDILKIIIACVIMSIAVTLTGDLRGAVGLIVKSSVGAIAYIISALLLNFANSRNILKSYINKFIG